MLADGTGHLEVPMDLPGIEHGSSHLVANSATAPYSPSFYDTFLIFQIICFFLVVTYFMYFFVCVILYIHLFSFPL